MSLVTMTREQLYDLVWSKPMRDAAGTIPISDRGLKKVCRRYAVPVPPQGYWNKLQAGHQVEQIPLPAPLSEKLRIVVMFEPGHEVLSRNRAEREALVTPEERAERKRQKVEARMARHDAHLASIRSSAKPRIPRSRPVRKERENRYVLSIKRWEWNYSFGMNNLQLVKARYLDGRILRVHGTLNHPVRFAGTCLEISFLPIEDLDGPRLAEIFPDCIGSFQKHPETKGYWAHVIMPANVLACLIPMLIAERLRYVVFGGSALSGGEGDIRRYGFEATVDLDDASAS